MSLFPEELAVSKDVAASLKSTNLDPFAVAIPEQVAAGEAPPMEPAPEPKKDVQTEPAEANPPAEPAAPQYTEDEQESMELFMDGCPIKIDKKEPFRIDTHEKFLWAMKKLYESEMEKLEKINGAKMLIGFHQNEIKNIEKYLDSEIEKINRRNSFLEAQVRGFVFQLEQEGKLKKKRSVSSPYGVAGFKSQQPRIEIADEEKCRQFLKKEHPELLKPQPEKIDWAELKKKLELTGDGKVIETGTGQVLGFMRGEQVPDKFSIKFKKLNSRVRAL